MDIQNSFENLNDQITWAIALAGFLVLSVTTHFLLKRRPSFKENNWHSSIYYALLGPVLTLAWILFGTFLAKLVISYFGMQDKIPSITPLRDIGAIACLTWSLFRWKAILQRAALLREVAGKSTLKPGSIETLGKFFTIVILFISLLLTLQVLGFDITFFVTFGGIGVAALAFATKDVIANFYGGIMAQMSHSFAIHDQIELPEKNVAGTIEKIGWYFTTIRDIEKKAIYIPNSLFSTECLINLSHMTHRYMNETIHLRFDEAGKVESLVSEIRQLLTHHPEIDASQPVYVYIEAFGPFSIHLNARAYTFTTNYEKFLEVKQSLLLKIYALIQKTGGTIYLAGANEPGNQRQPLNPS